MINLKHYLTERRILVQTSGFFRILYTIMEGVTRIAYINLLWILFTILGLIIGGFAPATTAMFTVTRKWAMGNTDIPIFKTFFRTYRSQFLKSNLLILPLLIAIWILYVDFQYLMILDGMFYNVMLFMFINGSIILFIIAIYLFPVFVHLDCTYLQNYKYALIIGFINPLYTFLMIISCLLIWMLMEFIPGLLPVFPFGLLGFSLMKLAHLAFSKTEAKKDILSIQQNITT